MEKTIVSPHKNAHNYVVFIVFWYQKTPRWMLVSNVYNINHEKLHNFDAQSKKTLMGQMAQLLSMCCNGPSCQTEVRVITV